MRTPTTTPNIRWAKLRPHLVGWAFISPWLVSFSFLMVYPFIASFILSFTRYQLIGEPEFIGFENIQRMLFDDPRVTDALRVTITYVLLTVPAGTAVSIFVAILLNQKVRGIPFFRTSFYMPSVIAASASPSCGRPSSPKRPLQPRPRLGRHRRPQLALRHLLGAPFTGAQSPSPPPAPPCSSSSPLSRAYPSISTRRRTRRRRRMGQVLARYPPPDLPRHLL